LKRGRSHRLKRVPNLKVLLGTTRKHGREQVIVRGPGVLGLKRKGAEGGGDLEKSHSCRRRRRRIVADEVWEKQNGGYP